MFYLNNAEKGYPVLGGPIGALSWVVANPAQVTLILAGQDEGGGYPPEYAVRLINAVEDGVLTPSQALRAAWKLSTHLS